MALLIYYNTIIIIVHNTDPYSSHHDTQSWTKKFLVYKTIIICTALREREKIIDYHA